jgi:dihydrodipicolinate synthase/N-acetylneuraminate lyase
MDFTPLSGISVAILTPFKKLEVDSINTKSSQSSPATSSIKPKGRPKKNTNPLPRAYNYPSLLEVDKSAYENHINYLYDLGVNTFVLFGTTGEGRFVNLEHIKAGLDVASHVYKKYIHTQKPVRFIGGIVRDSGSDILHQMAQYTTSSCIDSILLAPRVNLTNQQNAEKDSDTQIVDFYRQMRSRTHKPLIAYNIPQVTNVTITPDALEMIARQEYIVGIKDSAPIISLVDMAQKYGVQFIQGNDRLQAQVWNKERNLGITTHAAISGASNIPIYLVKELHILQAIQAQMPDRALLLERELNNDFSLLSCASHYGAESPVLKHLLREYSPQKNFPLLVCDPLKVYDESHKD